MESSTKRPSPGDPPELNQTVELLRRLLAVELDRLEVAREIERQRNIVFPETSVIVRDILRIQTEIDRREGGTTEKSMPWNMESFEL